MSKHKPNTLDSSTLYHSLFKLRFSRVFGFGLEHSQWMENVILSYFTIPKNYFINYIIPFYNTSNIQKLYYFTVLLKYYFLIFFYYFFPTIIFFSNSTTIPTVTFSIEPLHPTNGHIFNMYRSTSYQQLYFQHI